MNIFKKKTRKLPPPQSQLQEALFLLLTHPKGLTRKDFMDKAFIMNSPEIIRILRNKHRVWVDTLRIKHVNKFGRDVEFGRYQIPGRLIEHSTEVYLKLNKKAVSNGKK